MEFRELFSGKVTDGNKGVYFWESDVVHCTLFQLQGYSYKERFVHCTLFQLQL